MTEKKKSKEKEKALVKKEKTFPTPEGMSPPVHGHLMSMAEDSIADSRYIKPVDKGAGFQSGDQIIPQLSHAEVKAIDMNWVKFTGTPGQMFHKVPVTEPQPSEDYKRRIDISLSLDGEEEILSLPPNASQAFSGFYEKLLKNKIPVIGTRLNIGSRLAYRESDGIPYNLVTFSLANPNDADPNTIAAEWIDDEEDDEGAA